MKVVLILIQENIMIMNEKDILKFIQERDCVTFVEILNNFEEANGEYDWSIGDSDIKIYFYGGLSLKFMDILKKLLDEKKIWMDSTTVLTYVLDGGGLRLEPWTPKKKKGSFWLPMAFRPYNTIDEKYKKQWDKRIKNMIDIKIEDEI